MTGFRSKLAIKILFFLMSPLLLLISWPPSQFPYFIFLVLIPPLYALDLKNWSCVNKYVYVYSCFLIFNIGTTYWLYRLNIVGGILVHLLNPAIQTLPFAFLLIIKKRIKSDLLKYLFFCSSWLTIEFLHFNWFIKYPFLNLGNAFASAPGTIQWYQFTGVLGGTLWILVVNILIFEGLKDIIKGNRLLIPIKYYVSPALLIIVPILVSIWLQANNENDDKATINVLALHTSMDCRNEKYELSAQDLVSKYLEVSKQGLTPDIDYLIWPENAIPDLGWISELSSNENIQTIKGGLLDYPKLKLVTGAIVYELAPGGHKSANYSKEFNQWFFTYNSAIQVDLENQTLSYRFKEKLVPFEEENPAPFLVSISQKVIGSLGGFSFTSKSIKKPVFMSDSRDGVLTIVCYELLFGAHVAKLAREKTSAIFVLLNEGWYKNTVAAKQLMYYSSLRAIETQKPIIRSSNYGITCFINRYGHIGEYTQEDSNKLLHINIPVNNKSTVYMVLGDYLGIISFITFIILVFYIALLGR